ncbi:MAG: hypothetical protein WC882_04385 [Candidatus Gracilibacteria bacterium]
MIFSRRHSSVQPPSDEKNKPGSLESLVEGFYDELFMLSAKHRSLVALTVNEGDRRFANRIQRILGDRHVALDLGGSHAIAMATGYALAGKIPLLVGSAHAIFERGFPSLHELVIQPGLNIKMIGVSDSKEFLPAGFLKNFPTISFFMPHTYDETRSMVGSMMNRHGPACLYCE